jgi:hypothetical protein
LLSFVQGINSSPGGLDSRLAVGYPIDGIWVRTVAGYTDANHNGVIDVSEIAISDSAVYLGAQDPRFTSSFGSRLGLLNNRLSFDVQFEYQSGVTQYNSLGMTMLRSAASVPDATLDDQVAYLATLYISSFFGSSSTRSRYLYQTVDMLRWRSMSVNYMLPPSVTQLFHGRAMTVALQGSNLWLHTNYRGKDPNVNATLSGEGVTDMGQIPQPRTWVLRVTLTN